MYVYVPAYGLEKAYVCKCVYGPYMEGPNKAYVYEPQKVPQKAYVGPRRLMCVYEPTHGPQKAYVHICKAICIWAQYVHTYVCTQGSNAYVRL